MFTVGGVVSCEALAVYGSRRQHADQLPYNNETRRRVANWAYRPPRDACCKSVAGFYFFQRI